MRRALAATTSLLLLLAACKPKTTPLPSPALPPSPPPSPSVPAAAKLPRFDGLWITPAGLMVLRRQADGFRGRIARPYWDVEVDGRIEKERLHLKGREHWNTWAWTFVAKDDARLRGHRDGDTEFFDALRLAGPDKPTVRALESVLGHDETWVRRVAARTLGELGAEARSVLPLLLSKVADPDPAVALEAQMAASRLAPPEPEQEFQLRCLLEDPSVAVRRAAADALGALGASTAGSADALATLLHDPDPSLRYSAAWALGRLGPAALPALREALLDDGALLPPELARPLRRIGPEAHDLLPALDREEPKPDREGFWPQWRGPDRDNRSTDVDLLTSWPRGGPPLRWTVRGIGEGIAAPAVRDGRVVALGYIDGREVVTALDVATGRRLWSTVIGPSVMESGGMQWLSQRTPTLDQDLVFAFRADGVLVCLRSHDGREVWRKDYPREFKRKRMMWIDADYPIVDGDVLLCVPAAPSAAVAAFDKWTGRVLWTVPSPPGTSTSAYCAALLGTWNGARQMIARLDGAILGVDPSSGRLLWKSTQAEQGRSPGLPTATPLAYGSQLLLAAEYSERVLFRLDLPAATGLPAGPLRSFDLPRKAKAVWMQDSALIRGSNLYLPIASGLACIDLETEQVRWMMNSHGTGDSAITWADERLYVFYNSGFLQLVEPRADGVKLASECKLPGFVNNSGATNPVVTGGRLYLRCADRLACLDVRRSPPDGPPPAPLIRYLPPPGAPQVPTDPPTPAVFVPTPDDVVRALADLAEVSAQDVVWDLGSGDGRILIEAARRRARAVGVEIRPDLVDLSRERAAAAGVAPQVTVHHGDLLAADLRGATIVAAYLPAEFLARLRPKFEALPPGTRIVTHEFRIPGARPDREVVVESAVDGRRHPLYLWTTPLRTSVDWPMAGRDATRNAVSPEKDPPTEWSLRPGETRNVAWQVPVERWGPAGPVIANGVVWVGSNNRARRDPAIQGDGGVLLAFRESDGVYLGQRHSPRLRTLAGMDGQTGIPLRSTPLVEGDRLWYIDNRWEVVCLDVAGLKDGPRDPRILWSTDLIGQTGARPNVRGMGVDVAPSLGASWRGKIYVSTGTGLDPVTHRPAAPDAPGVVCLDRDTGAILGRDRSGLGGRTIGGEVSSPLVTEADGRALLLYGGGDGFLYAFEPDPEPTTKTLKERWRVDCNVPDRRRFGILATPVVEGGRAFVVIGSEMDAEGIHPGALTCVDLAAGRVLWQFREMEGALASPTVQGGVAYAVGASGILQALDAATGRLLWSHDTLCPLVAAPLWADGRLFLGTTDGEILIFDLRDGRMPPPVEKRILPGYAYSSLALAHGTLYVAGESRLYAIRDAGQRGGAQAEPLKRGRAPDALFVPTPMDVVAKMLDLADVDARGVVVDLGSGDGRIPILAARTRHCEAIGYELDAELVRESREAVRREGLLDRVKIEHEDLLKADLSRATVVTLYVGERLNRLLLPKLRALPGGVRIVSHQYGLPGIPPDDTLKIRSDEDGREHTLYMWRTPLSSENR